MLVAVGLALAVSVAACGAETAASASGGAAATSVRAGASSGATRDRARAGAFTLINGKHATLVSFAGRPVMVWFVAAGCASCEASIPVVAQHLQAFARAKTRVLVLGIYGAFGDGAQARAQLASWGRSTAGKRFANPAWTWAIASAKLTIAYDPGGVPDEYFLLDRTGRIAYQGSVPVSTMGALLKHVKEIRT